MDGKKGKTILDWPTPKSVSELWSFVKSTNDYRKLIRGYSKKVASLTDLLRKDKNVHGMSFLRRHLRNSRKRWP